MLLDEHDELWTELRHLFVAAVYSALASRFKDFQSKNKAAKAQGEGWVVRRGEGRVGRKLFRVMVIVGAAGEVAVCVARRGTCRLKVVVLVLVHSAGQPSQMTFCARMRSARCSARE